MELAQPWNEPWRPVRRGSAIFWVSFLSLFLLYAAAHRGEFLAVDNVNLVVHEGGHLLFGWLGATLGVWGGSLLQWVVPLLLASWFYWQRQAEGFVFCLFFFFENFLYSAIYMADARSMMLPLVTVGDAEGSAHDWNTIFGSLGLLEYDTGIAAGVRWIGWIGMLASVAWLARKFLRVRQSPDDAGTGRNQPSA